MKFESWSFSSFKSLFLKPPSRLGGFLFNSPFLAQYLAQAIKNPYIVGVIFSGRGDRI